MSKHLSLADLWEPEQPIVRTPSGYSVHTASKDQNAVPFNKVAAYPGGGITNHISKEALKLIYSQSWDATIPIAGFEEFRLGDITYDMRDPISCQALVDEAKLNGSKPFIIIHGQRSCGAPSQDGKEVIAFKSEDMEQGRKARLALSNQTRGNFFDAPENQAFITVVPQILNVRISEDGNTQIEAQGNLATTVKADMRKLPSSAASPPTASRQADANGSVEPPDHLKQEYWI